MLPCNVVVRKITDSETHVSMIKPSSMFAGIIGESTDPEIAELISKADESAEKSITGIVE